MPRNQFYDSPLTQRAPGTSTGRTGLKIHRAQVTLPVDNFNPHVDTFLPKVFTSIT